MNSRDEFLAVFLAHEADIRAFIGSIVLDRHMRQDIFQDVAMVLWQKFDQYDSAKPFGPWARAIAAHKILQHRHKNNRFPAAFPAEATPAILAAYERKEAQPMAEQVALDECIQSLPDRSRELLQLRYERDLRADEIGMMTGKSVDAVHQTLCRIRARLADCVRRRVTRAYPTSLGVSHG